MIKKYIIGFLAIGFLTISASASNTASCIGCHGSNFEKVALGQSKVVNSMKKTEIEAKLKEFKGAKYKGTMKPFASALSDKDIKEIADKFGK